MRKIEIGFFVTGVDDADLDDPLTQYRIWSQVSETAKTNMMLLSKYNQDDKLISYFDKACNIFYCDCRKYITDYIKFNDINLHGAFIYVRLYGKHNTLRELCLFKPKSCDNYNYHNLGLYLTKLRKKTIFKILNIPDCRAITENEYAKFTNIAFNDENYCAEYCKDIIKCLDAIKAEQI